MQQVALEFPNAALVEGDLLADGVGCAHRKYS